MFFVANRVSLEKTIWVNVTPGNGPSDLDPLISSGTPPLLIGLYRITIDVFDIPEVNCSQMHCRILI